MPKPANKYAVVYHGEYRWEKKLSFAVVEKITKCFIFVEFKRKDSGYWNSRLDKKKVKIKLFATAEEAQSFIAAFETAHKLAEVRKAEKLAKQLRKDYQDEVVSIGMAPDTWDEVEGEAKPCPHKRTIEGFDVSMKRVSYVCKDCGKDLM